MVKCDNCPLFNSEDSLCSASYLVGKILIYADVRYGINGFPDVHWWGVKNDRCPLRRIELKDGTTCEPEIVGD
jgi:hypothetical protein